MPHASTEIVLTAISQQEALSKGTPVAQLVCPKFEEQRYRYKCGHCDTELWRTIDPLSHPEIGMIFGCAKCHMFSRFDG